ncbi:hypothetical protein IKB17_02825 [bacterium]|nr:hypothetical protein [bacterium]
MLNVGNVYNQNKLFLMKKSSSNSSYNKPNQSRVVFQGKILKNPADSRDFFKKISGFLGFGATTSFLGINFNKTLKEEKCDLDIDILLKEWNSNSKGHKVLQDAGFLTDLIDKTISKMKLDDAIALKKGLTMVSIKDSEEMISKIYEGFYKDLKDEEKTALYTFNLLAEIFKNSEEGRIYINNVAESVETYGVNIYKKGMLNDGGFFGNSFAFVDKNGQII